MAKKNRLAIRVAGSPDKLNLQTYKIFNPDGTVKRPELTNHEKDVIKRAWKEKTDYLSKSAKNNPRELLMLARIYLLHEHAPEKAFRCYLQAKSFGSDANWNHLTYLTNSRQRKK